MLIKPKANTAKSVTNVKSQMLRGSNTMNYEKIKFSTKIKYKDMHKNYGRAEFEFCPYFFRGKLKKLFIVATQQEREDSGAWVLDFDKLDFKKCTSLQFESWTHKSFERPNCWLENWCEVHKTLCHRIYVPRGTNTIEFSLHFGNSITIRFDYKEENDDVV